MVVGRAPGLSATAPGRGWTVDEHMLLQARLDNFTDRQGLDGGTIETDGRRFWISMRQTLQPPAIIALEHWLAAETARLTDRRLAAETSRPADRRAESSRA